MAGAEGSPAAPHRLQAYIHMLTFQPKTSLFYACTDRNKRNPGQAETWIDALRRGMEGWAVNWGRRLRWPLSAEFRGP